MKIKLERVTTTLPADFESLRAEARANGHSMLDTLAREWLSGAMRFDRPGERLLAAHDGNVLAGIGGLTCDPEIPGALRMRRFYVRTAYRRAGVGRELAAALLDARGDGTITANAAPGSAKFWEALGFVPDRGGDHTYILR